MENEKLYDFDAIYKWLQMKIDEKYDDIDAKIEFMLDDFSKPKIWLAKSYSKQTLEDTERIKFLDSLLHHVKTLTNVQDVRDEIDKMNHQGNKYE